MIPLYCIVDRVIRKKPIHLGAANRASRNSFWHQPSRCPQVLSQLLL
jgi:hypothetical protein